MSKPLTAEHRQAKADQVADTGTLVSNMLGVRSQNGRTLVDLMNEAVATQIRAVSYNGSGGSGSDRPDPTFRAMVSGDAGLVTDARATVAAFDEALLAAARSIERAFEIGLSFLPRDPRPKELQTASLEEANRDAGCQSCARVRTSSGDRTFRSTWRTGRVASRPKVKAEAARHDKGRQRRALLTSDEDEDLALARLDREYRLCRSCYEHVEKLAPGAGMSLGRALPLAWVRGMLAKQAQRKAAEMSTAAS